MGVKTYKPSGGSLTCTVSIGGDEPLAVPVHEISAAGALIELDVKVERHEYIDTVLQLKQEDVTLFAHVVSVEGVRVKLRWLHFDPGEEDSLGGKLDAHFADGDVEVSDQTKSHFAWSAGEKEGTRRVVRPTTAADAPKPPTKAVPAKPQTKAQPAKPQTKAQTKAVPAEPAIEPKAAATDAGPAQAPKGESGARPKVASEAPKADEDDDGLMPDAAPAMDAALTGNWRQKEAESQPSKAKDEGTKSHLAIVATDKFARIQQPEGGEQKDGTKRFTATHQPKDVNQKILSKARTVTASELAARHDKVRVLNLSTIRQLIKESVEDSIADLGRDLSEDDEAKLMAQVEDRVNEAMKSFKAEKADMAARSEKLQAQLEEARKQLENERKRKINADRFTMSEEGMVDLEQRLDRMVQRAIRLNGVDDELAEELQKMVSHVLDKERQKIADHAKKAQQDAITLLEKKVERLASNLEETSKDRDRHRRALAMMESQGGVLGNVMDIGLSDEDPDKERKLDLLKEIAKENRELRESYKESHGGKLPEGRKKPKSLTEKLGKETKSEVAKVAEGGEEAPSADAPEPAEDTAAETQPEVAEGEDGPADVNPDDLPWEGPPAKEEEDPDSPVKKMSGYKDFAPPPLTVKDSAAADRRDTQDRQETVIDVESPAEDAEDRTETVGDDLPIDPDDMPWEGPPQKEDEDPDSPVKKMTSFKNFEPPPLKKS